MLSMFIETESTPNPATIKFLPGLTVMAQGTRDFATASEAMGSPFATALFALDGVAGVFFGRDFVSVSIDDPARWSALKPDILATILDQLTSGQPLFEAGKATTKPAAELFAPAREEDADIVDQILDLVETRVRPAVANDGGDIIYRGYADGTVYLQMQGACAGCPSSTATLKHGIESLLKHYVPEVEHVVAV